jgi:hypothetical protein
MPVFFSDLEAGNRAQVTYPEDVNLRPLRRVQHQLQMLPLDG